MIQALKLIVTGIISVPVSTALVMGPFLLCVVVMYPIVALIQYIYQ